MEYDNLYGWVEETVTYAKILPKMVNPRDIAGSAEEDMFFYFDFPIQVSFSSKKTMRTSDDTFESAKYFKAVI